MRERLFPPWGKKVGVAALALGLCLGVLRLGFGVKPGWLELPVFAMSSAYFESKFFTVITKNLTDEVILLSTLGGLFLVALSRERDETLRTALLRLDSLLLALKVNAVLLGAALVTVFGLGFVGVLFANLYTLLGVYLLVFHTRLRRPAEAPC